MSAASSSACWSAKQTEPRPISEHLIGNGPAFFAAAKKLSADVLRFRWLAQPVRSVTGLVLRARANQVFEERAVKLGGNANG